MQNAMSAIRFANATVMATTSTTPRITGWSLVPSAWYSTWPSPGRP